MLLFIRLNQILTAAVVTLTPCPLRSLVCATAPTILMSYYTSGFYRNANLEQWLACDKSYESFLCIDVTTVHVFSIKHSPLYP